MTSRSTPRRLLASLAALAFLALVPATASAHAELVRAIPADGETVTEPVTVLSGRYTEDLTGNSSLRVLDAAGATVATDRIDPENPRRMIARPESPLLDGTYTVRSTATSTDGHTERVTWTFTVAVAASPSPTAEPTPTASAEPSAASPTPAATPSPSIEQTASPSATAAPSDPTSGGGSDVLLPILAALAIVAVGAGFLLLRGRGTG
jgi:methionine-rich copper-binding protein CopC